MTEKCTKTSSPVERWMNPYPFAPLNHFTVPFSLTEKTPFASALRINSLPLSDQLLDRPRHALQKNGRPGCISDERQNSLQKRKTPSVPPHDEMRSEPPKSGKSGAVFYHPARN